MSKLNVLVVGASVAGPTTAYWLARAGAKVTVIERFPKLRMGGQNIDIRTIGVSVMRKMQGMEAAVLAKKMELDGISFVRRDGYSYGVLRATGNPDQQSLVSEYEILRGDLAQILFDMTKDDEDIEYVFGEQVAAIHQSEADDGPVTVEFLNGTPTSKYDLVVACDGATSRTRSIGLGCGLRDHMIPINSWAAYFSMQPDITGGSKIGQAFSAPGGRFMALGPDPLPDTSRVVLMGLHPRTAHDATLPFREAAAQSDEALKQFVAKHFQGAGWKTDEVLKGMMGSADFYSTEIFQVMPPTLHKGRFVLVGDAGYAPGPTGGGTTLAMAGAYLLAGEVVKHKGDLAAGLRGYEDRMRPIVKELQKIPPLVPTVMAPQTAWGIWLRNNIFAFITWSGVLNFAQRFFGGAFDKNDEDKLPDYEWVR